MRRVAALITTWLVLVTAPVAVAATHATKPVGHGLLRFQHLVVIDLENHSFDNLYGEFPGADGFATARILLQVDSSGTPYATLPVTSKSRVPPGLPNRPFAIEPYVPADEKTEDLSHAYDDEREELDGGRMDRFVCINQQKALALGYYHTMKLPLAAFASEYTLCDRFFHAAIGGSLLSHMWLVAAASPQFPHAPESVRIRYDAHGHVVHAGFVTPDDYVVNTSYSIYTPHPASTPDSIRIPPIDLPNIGDRLSGKGVSWAWYSGGWDDALAGHPAKTFQFHHNPFAYFRRYGDGTAARREHLKDETEFVRAAHDGRLPAVAFVKPLGENNEHPGYADVLTGERHVAQLIRTIQAGPEWRSTAIVVTYDENGGFWDHIAPPIVDRWGPGSRVPTIVIAPFARRHYIDHTTYDTTSILALIEKRWGLLPLSTRDAHAAPLTGPFDFGASPRRPARR